MTALYGLRDRMGIFGNLQSLDWPTCLFIEASSSRTSSEKGRGPRKF